MIIPLWRLQENYQYSHPGPDPGMTAHGLQITSNSLFFGPAGIITLRGLAQLDKGIAQRTASHRNPKESFCLGRLMRPAIYIYTYIIYNKMI